MIDTYFRNSFQKVLVCPIIKQINRTKVSPNILTGLALGLGICVAPALAFRWNFIAVSLLILSGYLDMLDGSLARLQKHSKASGAVIDIVSDRIVEFSVVLGLFLVDPVGRGLLCMLMLGSILVCVTSFLVVGIFIENESEKGFHYSPGLIERSETFLFFGVMILIPESFGILSLLFAGLVFTTGFLRIKEFVKN